MTEHPDIESDSPPRFPALRLIHLGLHYVAGVLLVSTMLLTVANVIGRRFFSQPIPGAIELTEVSMALIVYLGFAHAQDMGDHIAVDIVYLKLPEMIRPALNAIGALLSAAVAGMLAWQLYLFAVRMYDGGYTTSVLRVPLHLVAFTCSLGALMFTLAFAASAARSVRKLMGER